MFGQQLLDLRVVEQLVLRKAQNAEGLLLSHKAAFNAQALLRDLLATLVREPLVLRLGVLFVPIPAHAVEPLALR